MHMKVLSQLILIGISQQDKENLMPKSSDLLNVLKIRRIMGHLGGSVRHSTLDFSSGLDLTVCEFKPHIGLCADGVKPPWNSLSPSLFTPS